MPCLEGRTPVKAIVQDSYGSPDVLELRDIDPPVVNDDGVLVRVREAAVNPPDWAVSLSHTAEAIGYFGRGTRPRKDRHHRLRTLPRRDRAPRVPTWF